MAMRERNDTMTLVFLHLPKTAGSTIRDVLTRNYRADKLFRVKVRNREFYLARLSIETRLRDFDCVFGHFGYGIHRYIHNDCQYFTMLRDPIQRVISLYFFALHKKDHPLHKAVALNRMSLEDFADSGIGPGINNHQTRLLAAVDGRYKRVFDPAEIGEDQFSMARKNLEGMAAVGLTEMFDESLLLFANKFGWRDIRYTRLNVSARQKGEVTPYAIERIMANNEYDLRLYDYAKYLVKKQIEDYNGNLEEDLREFRKYNVSSPVLQKT
ncbi:MAG: hypothetical protein EHJ95_08380 [Methanobacteriota archaeon]|nr:MAG: hypothetical protein EHJ95_08380 [Euryarchaeota archaeon]